jgi:hypothetical protein
VVWLAANAIGIEKGFDIFKPQDMGRFPIGHLQKYHTTKS